jgi:hypothetical protein
VKRRKRTAPEGGAAWWAAKRYADQQEQDALADPTPLERWCTVVYVCPVHGEHRSSHIGEPRGTCQRTYNDPLGLALQLCDRAVLSATVEREWLR